MPPTMATSGGCAFPGATRLRLGLPCPLSLSQKMPVGLGEASLLQEKPGRKKRDRRSEEALVGSGLREPSASSAAPFLGFLLTWTRLEGMGGSLRSS